MSNVPKVGIECQNNFQYSIYFDVIYCVKLISTFIFKFGRCKTDLSDRINVDP